MSELVRPQNAALGIGFMLGAMASLPFIDVLAKILGAGGVPILQIVFARVAFGALAALPFALRETPPRGLWPRRFWVHVLRAGLLAAATFLFFFALKTLPIADALAIFFVQPIIVTALGGLLLREAVDGRRWLAVIIGFIGILVILRPGHGAMTSGSLLALGAGATLALYFLLSRWVAGGASAILVTFQTNAIAAMGLCALMPMVWIPPNPSQWAMLAALGVVASFGHFLILRAYTYAEASLLAPLAYSEIIMATVLGWLFFDDFPDVYTVLGVGILVCAALLTAWPARARDPAASLAKAALRD